jgi:hypothetical protein
VASYSDETKLHTIHYDDGDVKASNLHAKIWSLVLPPT